MGKKKAFIFIGSAIVIALIISSLVYTRLQRGFKEAKALQTQAAVAVVDLSLGTEIKKEMIKMAPFLKESLPQGYFSEPSSLEGRVVISPIKANEPIFESRLAPIDIKTGGVAAAINSKKRAMAVKVDKVIGVSGFIHPGNRVDVLVTLSKGDVTTSVTKTVLQNILVLTVGPEIEEKKKEKPSMVDVITLEVTPEEGEKLALAATEGRILLSLRNPIDTENVITKGTTIPTLLASYNQVKNTSPETGRNVRGKKQTVVPEKSPAIKHPTIKVDFIKGSKLSELTFERSD